jgi:hypothetical protein
MYIDCKYYETLQKLYFLIYIILNSIISYVCNIWAIFSQANWLTVSLDELQSMLPTLCSRTDKICCILGTIPLTMQFTIEDEAPLMSLHKISIDKISALHISTFFSESERGVGKQVSWEWGKEGTSRGCQGGWGSEGEWQQGSRERARNGG